VIARTLAGVVAALLAFWLAVQVAPEELAPGVPEAIPLSVASAPLPIACPGSLAIPVGDVGGTAGSIGSGSDDLRESVFTEGADTPTAAGDGWASSSSLATEIERVGGGDIAGLAAIACLAPRNDAWLVGGSTDIGSSARLVLTNPAGVASDVAVTLYGPAGRVEQGMTVAIGPHSQSSYLLEGVAAGLSTLVVHIEATAAGVTAAIQDSRLDGFLPAGTEWVVPNEALAAHVEIPGVGPSDPEGFAGPSVVRLFAPEDAIVTLKLVTSLGTEPWPAGENIQLRAGKVVEIQVPPTAVATVVIDASTPVLAAGYTTTGRPPDEALQGTAARDSAWVNGQAHSADRSYSVVVPHYAVSAVVFSATTTTFRAVDPAGVVMVTFSLPAWQTTEVPLGVPSGTVLEVEGAISWSIRVIDLPGFITAIQPEDVGPVDTVVSVAPGFYVP
jgi:hypothetical protein